MLEFTISDIELVKKFPYLITHIKDPSNELIIAALSDNWVVLADCEYLVNDIVVEKLLETTPLKNIRHVPREFITKEMVDTLPLDEKMKSVVNIPYALLTEDEVCTYFTNKTNECVSNCLLDDPIAPKKLKRDLIYFIRHVDYDFDKDMTHHNKLIEVAMRAVHSGMPLPDTFANDVVSQRSFDGKKHRTHFKDMIQDVLNALNNGQ